MIFFICNISYYSIIQQRLTEVRFYENIVSTFKGLTIPCDDVRCDKIFRTVSYNCRKTDLCQFEGLIMKNLCLVFFELPAGINQLLGKDFSKQDNLYSQVNYLALSTKCFSPSLYFLAGRQPELPKKSSMPTFILFSSQLTWEHTVLPIHSFILY